MNKDEAIKIAQKHIENLNANNPYKDVMVRTLSEPVKIDLGFYFDYTFDLINPDPDNPIGFGGAPGFVVNDDEKIIDLNWGEYHKLNIPKDL